MQYEIEKFGLAMQSLTSYVENLAITSDGSSQAIGNACHQSENDVHMDTGEISEDAEISDSSTEETPVVSKARASEGTARITTTTLLQPCTKMPT